MQHFTNTFFVVAIIKYFIIHFNMPLRLFNIFCRLQQIKNPNMKHYQGHQECITVANN